MRRKIPADYLALAKKRGFRWLGPEVPNTSTKTGWECGRGHKWKAGYNSIDQGSGCPVCAGSIPKTPDDYYELARKRGFRWVGPEVSTAHTKTTWECQQGHQWVAAYHDIQQGNGCPVCAVERKAEQRRNKPADYRALAQERGLRWVGPEVPNNRIKTTWECEQGHRWEAVYGNIQQGRGCPVCAGHVPKTSADYHALAEERGFLWIGPEVPTTLTKTYWECERGHRWQAPYGRIQQGHGCPHCYGKVPKSPNDYHALAEERGFHWLGPKVSNTSTKTGWECEEGHRWKATYSNVQNGTGCPFCYGHLPKTPADYHALAEERGFRWIESEAPNVATKTVWECDQGHQWNSTFDNIQQAHGCPFCANRVPKTPGDYHALAEERGFRWLGPEVPTTGAKTWWECEQGHRWEIPYSTLQGCLFCSGKAPKTPADYLALAEERGFRWIGPEVPNTDTKTWWECDQGHQWEAVYHNVSGGTGCPSCVDMVYGARVSQVQRDLCDMLGGELNRPFGRRNIDVALVVDGVTIAVEYDSWFWHGHELDGDSQRDEELLAAGWRVLHVMSNALLPTREQLDNAIARLLAGEKQTEIVLEDWGQGPTRFEPD